MRTKINNKAKKIEILRKQQWNKCYYCNCTLIEWDIYKHWTLDHIEPYCKVWNNTKYVLACNICNRLKGSLSIEEYQAGYIDVNFKPWWDMQSYNKAVKVRWPIKWYQKLFADINFFWWSKYKKEYKTTLKLYN